MEGGGEARYIGGNVLFIFSQKGNRVCDLCKHSRLSLLS